mmetsp:Transcript_6799/g.12370  ORF Transcript_6799/g.12370 Transcript_6799/m.12370 type:complete len:161 (-) Transcript_6799:1336-1818(-)
MRAKVPLQARRSDSWGRHTSPATTHALIVYRHIPSSLSEMLLNGTAREHRPIFHILQVPMRKNSFQSCQLLHPGQVFNDKIILSAKLATCILASGIFRSWRVLPGDCCYPEEPVLVSLVSQRVRTPSPQDAGSKGCVQNLPQLEHPPRELLLKNLSLYQL